MCTSLRLAELSNGIRQLHFKEIMKDLFEKYFETLFYTLKLYLPDHVVKDPERFKPLEMPGGLRLR